MKIQLFFIAALLGISAQGKSAAKKAAPDLKVLFHQIRSAPFVTLNVEKKTKSELLGTETVSPGVIYISDDKFRWDTEGKEKSRIIYDGKTIWTIQDPPKGFKVPPQVTKMKLDKKNENQILLKSLFHDKFDSQFKITKATQDKTTWVYKLVPVKKDAMVNDLEIKVSSKKEISEIAYTDEVQNKISVLVNKVSLSKKPDLKLFQYKPPAGAQVTEI